MEQCVQLPYVVFLEAFAWQKAKNVPSWITPYKFLFFQSIYLVTKYGPKQKKSSFVLLIIFKLAFFFHFLSDFMDFAFFWISYSSRNRPTVGGGYRKLNAKMDNGPWRISKIQIVGVPLDIWNILIAEFIWVLKIETD